MSKTREEFHSRLSTITGAKYIYYQPPSNTRMSFPCIEYHDAPMDVIFANDMPYVGTRHYQLTVIDPLPDSAWIQQIQFAFQMCVHNRHYTSDGLNHDVFDIYY